MDFEKFVTELETELEKRYNYCEDFAATPCSILLGVLNAVAQAKKTATSQQANPADSEQRDHFDGKYFIEYVSADVVHLRRCR